MNGETMGEDAGGVGGSDVQVEKMLLVKVGLMLQVIKMLLVCLGVIL